jgi:hypothetical protein
MARAWTIVGVVVLGLALAQLTFVSGVWLPTQDHPTAKMKLAIYFSQVRGLAVAPHPRHPSTPLPSPA